MACVSRTFAGKSTPEGERFEEAIDRGRDEGAWPLEWPRAIASTSLAPWEGKIVAGRAGDRIKPA